MFKIEFKVVDDNEILLDFSEVKSAEAVIKEFDELCESNKTIGDIVRKMREDYGIQERD